MASSILEQLRSDQEDIEYLEKAIVKALFLKSENPRNVVLADFMIKQFIDSIVENSVRSLKIYQDADGLKSSEREFLEGQRKSQDATGNKALDVWINFYEKLSEIKDYHERFTPYGQPTEIHDEDWYFLHALDDRSKIPKFTGQEGGGRFLDLHANYLEFINLKKLQQKVPMLVRKLEYVSYLASFDQFHEIPLYCKDSAYKTYLENLLDYLKSFYIRTQPLFNIHQFEQQHKKEFEVKWNDRTLRGWEHIPKKSQLNSNPLYCFPCRKLFTNLNVFNAHTKGAKHKKNVEKISDLLEEPEAPELNHYKEVAYYETFITRLRETLGDSIDDTMNNIRKRQTRTAEELEAELYESEEDDLFDLPIEEIKRKSEKKLKDESSESEDDRPPYNPMNLPIGWDGKPIPYWLYKLNGLNKEFKCEICGNYSYWGRRAFERHFQEWRHAYGMRCLRIPNTQHFRDITKIDEAIKCKYYCSAQEADRKSPTRAVPCRNRRRVRRLSGYSHESKNPRRFTQTRYTLMCGYYIKIWIQWSKFV